MSQKNDNKSMLTLSNMNNDNDSIPFRIDFIKQLIKNGKIEPLINDFDNTCDTEKFINPINSNDKNSIDTRHVLNKKLYNFYKVIQQIGGKLLYIKSGSTGHTFQGIVPLEDGECFNYAVKVSAYPKKEQYGNIYDIRRPENAELMIIKLLSYFVIKEQTPHIVLPLGTFNTSIEPFIKLIESDVVDKKNKKYAEFIEKYNNGEYFDQTSILMSEWANRGDLADFIRKFYNKFKPLHWKTIFFQIISTLAVIQSKYPSFRHNDLKANNILVHKVNKTVKKNWYTVMGHKYNVPNIGYQIKLWDFDFACIPGVVENSKVCAEWTTHINVIPEQNRYYDIHYFFNTLIKKPFFPQFMTDNLIPTEAKEFINRIVPLEYQNNEKNVHKRGRFLLKQEYIIPRDILENDPYFEEFRKKKNITNNNLKTHVYNKHKNNNNKCTNEHNITNNNNNGSLFTYLKDKKNSLSSENINNDKIKKINNNIDDMFIEDLILEKIYNGI